MNFSIDQSIRCFAQSLNDGVHFAAIWHTFLPIWSDVWSLHKAIAIPVKCNYPSISKSIGSEIESKRPRFWTEERKVHTGFRCSGVVAVLLSNSLDGSEITLQLRFSWHSAGWEKKRKKKNWKKVHFHVLLFEARKESLFFATFAAKKQQSSLLFADMPMKCTKKGPFFSIMSSTILVGNMCLLYNTFTWPFIQLEW